MIFCFLLYILMIWKKFYSILSALKIHKVLSLESSKSNYDTTSARKRKQFASKIAYNTTSKRPKPAPAPKSTTVRDWEKC